MKSFIRIALIAFVLAQLQACAMMHFGNRKVSNLYKLHNGMTQEEVVKVLGEPARTLNEGEIVRWDYVLWDTEATSMGNIVTTDHYLGFRDGKLIASKSGNEIRSQQRNQAFSSMTPEQLNDYLVNEQRAIAAEAEARAHAQRNAQLQFQQAAQSAQQTQQFFDNMSSAPSDSKQTICQPWGKGGYRCVEQ